MHVFFKYKYAYWAVMIMGILLPWGELTKIPIPGFGRDFGSSTFLGFYIIGYGLFSGMLQRGLRRWPGAIALLIFAVYTIFTAQFSLTKIEGVFLSIKLFNYVLLGVIFYEMPLSRVDMVRLLRYITISGAIVIGISIIDRVTPISVHKFNLSLGNVKTGDKGVFVKDMCGPFSNRSAFATYLSLYLPVIVGLSQLPLEKRWIRWICTLMIPVTLLAIILASSRGLFLGVIAIFGYFFFTTYGAKKFGQLLGAGVLVSISLVVFMLMNPIGFEAFVGRFTSIFSSKNQIEENVVGKDFRAETMRIVITDLGRNPLGQGLGKVYMATHGEFKNLHCSYLEFIRAGGPIGLILILIAFLPLVRGFAKPRDVMISRVFYAAILCIAIYNLTHSQWPFAMMWIYIGICMKFTGRGWIYPEDRHRGYHASPAFRPHPMRRLG